MSTSGSIVISGSNYTPGSTVASSSLYPVTASLLGATGKLTIIVSGSNFVPGTTQASSSLYPVTGSQLGGVGYATNVVVFTTSVTGSVTGSTSTTTYVLTGWYRAGASRETWSGTSINTPNPSGHALVDITVMGSYPPINTAT